MELTLIADRSELGRGASARLSRAGAQVTRHRLDDLDRVPRALPCVLALSDPRQRSEVLTRLVAVGASALVLCPDPGPEAIADALGLGALDAWGASCHQLELAARLKRAAELASRFEALEERTRSLEQLSATDPLTGVSNRRHFEARLTEELRRALRYDDPLSLVLLDLDHFKAINDSHGHLVGDAVLTAVARAIQDSVRDTDLVARYGGEEFALILPRTHLAGSLSVAERVRNAVRQLDPVPGTPLRITASLGLASHPGVPLAQAAPLLAAADAALYRAKAEGRDRICLHSPRPEPPRRVGSHPG